jgi:arginine/lysine/ornithine decarboxylase
MNYSILLIDPEAKRLKEVANLLEQQGMTILTAQNLQETELLLLNNGTIQAVLTSWKVPYSKENGEYIVGEELFRHISRIRFEVDIFLLTNKTAGEIYSTGGLLSGYFYRGDNDYEDIANKIHSVVYNGKIRAPFFDALVEYANTTRDSWHTPGHAGGFSVKNSPWIKDFYSFFGHNIFASDLSVSVPALDSLLDPKGVIKEAQELAARAFGSRYTFFTTNGTSTSNKILIQTLLKPGDAILLDRNCHKSVHYGVIISGAEPIYLMPSVNNKYGIFGPIPKKQIIEKMDKAIADGKRVKAIILTNCTYDGLIYDIADIVKEAHARGIKIIVDEAWFGYAHFHPEFAPCAMEAGADYATQSTHKTMSAFSQASMVHVQDPDFEKNREFFTENLNMHTSTSPQYTMIASLDIARKQMVMEGYSLLSNTLRLSEMLKQSVNSLKKFRVLELEDLISEEVKDDNIRLDKTKVTIDVTNTGYTAHEVERILMTKHNIQVEKTTFNTLTLLLTIGTTQSKINRLYFALESIERMSGNLPEAAVNEIWKDFKLKLSPIKYLPRAAFYTDGEMIPLRNAIGRICSTMIVPYPPGIPFLVPGQLITEDIVNALQVYRDYNVEIHGLSEGLIKVCTTEEELELAEKGHGIVQ